MSLSESDIISKAEAILASAKEYKGDRSERYALMKQVNLLYQQLEDPMDAMLRQWTFVRVLRLGARQLGSLPQMQSF